MHSRFPENAPDPRSHRPLHPLARALIPQRPVQSARLLHESHHTLKRTRRRLFSSRLLPTRAARHSAIQRTARPRRTTHGLFSPVRQQKSDCFPRHAEAQLHQSPKRRPTPWRLLLKGYMYSAHMANSNVQHGPGAHAGFLARFDSRYEIDLDRPRAVPKHNCIRVPKGGLPHGACCYKATCRSASPTWQIPTYSTAQEHIRAFQPGSTAHMRSLLIELALCRSTAAYYFVLSRYLLICPLHL